MKNKTENCKKIYDILFAILIQSHYWAQALKSIPHTRNRVFLYIATSRLLKCYPDSNVHGANMGPIWGQQDPDGPRVGPMNFAIWVGMQCGEDLDTQE